MSETSRRPALSAVSRFLGQKFTRSESSPTRVKGFRLFSAGFSVRKSLERGERDDHVVVECVVGDRGRYMTPERRREHIRESLDRYRSHLEQRYDVTLNERKDALLVRKKGCPAPVSAGHHTAWVNTDRTALESDYCDVAVLADEEVGERDGQPVWSSVGDPLFSAEIAVRHDGDPDEALRQAEELLAEAGWSRTDAWEAVPSGYVATVERGRQRG